MNTADQRMNRLRVRVAEMWSWCAKEMRFTFDRWPKRLRDTSDVEAAAEFISQVEAQAARAQAELDDGGEVDR